LAKVTGQNRLNGKTNVPTLTFKQTRNQAFQKMRTAELQKLADLPV
jgi:hypothetical protein